MIWDVLTTDLGHDLVFPHISDHASAMYTSRAVRRAFQILHWTSISYGKLGEHLGRF
jgi:hypothetical protein